MATMTARKVDDADYALLCQEADRTEKLRAAKMMVELSQLRLAPKGSGKSPNSLDLIRAIRDEE